jgi:transcriptional regulator with XRE-family HTH domain
MRKQYLPTEERVKLTSGDVVKVAREMLNMTQAELAKKTGISPSHISEIEGNRVEMSRNRAFLLSKVLKIPAPYIMFPRPDYYFLKNAA